MSASPCVITIVADGARPDTLAAAMRGGTLPALARLRDEGAATTLTTVFPSVTGPAYVPFLTGRHPGTAGLPGLRWFDRTRTSCGWPLHARSYVGVEMRHADRDLYPAMPTLFELEAPAVGALSVIGRGLPPRDRIGGGLPFALRAAWTHFRGDLAGWLALDQRVADRVVERVTRDRPRYVFAALTGIDKASHAAGHDAPIVRDAMRIVDGLVAQLRTALERDGRWPQTQLVVVSDHGHSAVHAHDDLVGAVAALGLRTLAHPFHVRPRADVAVMVSGNAMAHLYVELARPERPFWPALEARWSALLDALLARRSIDLAILPRTARSCDIHARGRGHARLEWRVDRYDYRPISGDPLGIGAVRAAGDAAAHAATAACDYPDALVQIARLAECPRSGDLILSAARGWDLRARWEPIPHVSSHGALHAEHMRVPVLLSRRPARRPVRTTELFALARDALGRPLILR